MVYAVAVAAAEDAGQPSAELPPEASNGNGAAAEVWGNGR